MNNEGPGRRPTQDERTNTGREDQPPRRVPREEPARREQAPPRNEGSRQPPRAEEHTPRRDPEPKPRRDIPEERAVSSHRPKFQMLDTENLDPTDMDALDNAQEAPVDLTQEYWTPENIGESRRMVFTGIHDRDIIDSETGELERTLPCAFFLYKDGEDVKTVCQGSKRLVGAFENGKIKKGAPVSVTYLGRKKNKTNQYQSDQWSVKPLLIELK